MKNEYIPIPAIIEKIREETSNTKTFCLKFKDKKNAETFQYKPGQFVEVSIFGAGEIPISIASSPSKKNALELTIRATGMVTNKIHNLKKGNILYLRGPYGRHFPLKTLERKNIYFIAGGIGLAPLRGLIKLVFENRKNFKEIKILYGAKTVEELCYKNELKTWKTISNTQVFLTVDNQSKGWNYNLGPVTELWKDANPTPANAIAIVCGPPIMMKFVSLKLIQSGFKENQIIMTLERHMKCGIGKCGHCNIGEKFVCVDGPVFTYQEVKQMPLWENVF